MSQNIKMTMIDAYNYMQVNNKDLFANFKIPEGMSTEDFETLKNNILLTAGEFEILYPNMTFFQFAIGIWSNKHYWTFNKWIKALNIEYEPLENFRRIEHWTDNNTGTQENSSNRAEVLSATNTSNETNTNTTVIEEETTSANNTSSNDNSNTSTENKKSAFNSDTYQPDNTTLGNSTNTTTLEAENESTRDVTNTSNGSVGVTARNTRDITNNDLNIRTDNLLQAHDGLMYGNIGVTTSQQMLEAELEVAKFNLIQNISDMFVDEFCIKVY